ncbi:HemK family protein methyltransferase [Nocardioides sp. Bht2]|uniref:HemK family protein methyltransferase n=1 Tax=Nocardioides sp. Bht2 TaxID=3392297 RepID=UPI0039B6BEE4
MDEVAAALRAAGCVWADEEAAILRAHDGDLATLLARRVAGEPLAHVTGWTTFGQRRLTVAPGVFVPRPRTELLARMAAERARAGSVVVELCCGVAPVAAVVADASAESVVHGVDVDAAALVCATENVPSGHFHRGDLFAALPRTLARRIDLLVASPPYVPSADLDLLDGDARRHEPRSAHDGGPDGLTLARRIVAEAGSWLAPHGRLLIEVARHQAAVLAEAFAAARLASTVVRDDELGATVVVNEP